MGEEKKRASLEVPSLPKFWTEVCYPRQQQRWASTVSSRSSCHTLSGHPNSSRASGPVKAHWQPGRHLNKSHVMHGVKESADWIHWVRDVGGWHTTGPDMATRQLPSLDAPPQRRNTPPGKSSRRLSSFQTLQQSPLTGSVLCGGKQQQSVKSTRDACMRVVLKPRGYPLPCQSPVVPYASASLHVSQTKHVKTRHPNVDTANSRTTVVAVTLPLYIYCY